jgi:hypothetical protein
MEIDMRGEQLDLGSKLKCTVARWWSGTSRCAIVEFDELGNSNNIVATFSLRLDLDKIVFLDHAKDRMMDNIVQGKVREIWEVIVNRRLHMAPSLGGSMGTGS